MKFDFKVLKLFYRFLRHFSHETLKLIELKPAFSKHNGFQHTLNHRMLCILLTRDIRQTLRFSSLVRLSQGESGLARSPSRSPRYPPPVAELKRIGKTSCRLSTVRIDAANGTYQIVMYQDKA